MASGRYKGRGRVAGTIFGKDRNWFSEGQDERRFNHAMDLCRETTKQTVTCLKCHQRTMKCTDAGVTTKLGARSWWKCSNCGHELTREITPEQMAEYYQEDLNRMLNGPQPSSKTQEAEA